MIKKFTLSLIFILFVIQISISATEKSDSMYDVIIVGGGIAGLSAAENLKQFKVLILEKEDMFGGSLGKRQYIPTLNYKENRLFLSFPMLNYLNLPIDITSYSKLQVNGLVGILDHGKIHYGNSPLECLNKLELTNNEKSSLISFQQGKPNIRFSKRLLRILNNLQKNSLININLLPSNNLFPGFVLINIPKSFLIKAGSSLVKSLLSRSFATKITNANVISVEEINDRQVKVEYIKNKEKHTFFAKYVMVSTPSNIAAKIIKPMPNKTKSFLDQWKYKKAIIVTIGLKTNNLKDFSYICTPGLSMQNILKASYLDNTIIISAKFMGYSRNWNKSDQYLINETIATLKQLNIGNIKQDIIYSFATRIENYSIANNKRLITRSNDLKVSKRVILNGGYLYYLNSVGSEKAHKIDGVPAFHSGKFTANIVRKLLISELNAN
jgi:hypothetical protein